MKIYLSIIHYMASFTYSWLGKIVGLAHHWCITRGVVEPGCSPGTFFVCLNRNRPEFFIIFNKLCYS